MYCPKCKTSMRYDCRCPKCGYTRDTSERAFDTPTSDPSPTYDSTPSYSDSGSSGDCGGGCCD